MRERGLRMSQYQYAYESLLKKEAQKLERDVFSIAIQRLHISVVPQNLPCRDHEKLSVTDFIRKRIIDRETSGPLFLCGMPGTGKTATVLSSINALRDEVSRGSLPDFNFTEINCLHLKHPIDACKSTYCALLFINYYNFLIIENVILDFITFSHTIMERLKRKSSCCKNSIG